MDTRSSAVDPPQPAPGGIDAVQPPCTPAEEPQSEYRACFNDLPNGAVHLVFRFLGPRELCIASAVCRHWRDLNRDGVANRVWHGHFARRWRVPTLEGSAGWQAQYGRKMRGARAFGGRGLADMLYGHAGAVQAVALLPCRNLLATGSADCTVRLWDLQAGLPQACSSRLPGPAKCLALDEQLLVCGGGQDGALRLWRCRPGPWGSAFNLAAPMRLRGHTGPVVSLALDARNVYSASWDCTVRLWSKESLRRVSLLAFPDWVTAAKPRGSHLLVTAGQTLHVHSLATGQGIGKWQHTPAVGQPWDAGLTTAPLHVEGSRDGRTAFLAGADGAISAIDLRSPSQRVAVLWSQRSPVRGLSFEDPWLAAAGGDGAALLLDVDAALRGGRGGGGAAGGSRRLPGRQRASRQRLAAGAGPAFCVDIADNALACGSADSVVRTWSFADRAEARAATVPPRQRGSRRRRNRFAFAADSGESEEEASRGGREGAHSIPLSQSLPASLGGPTAAQLRPRTAQSPAGSGSDAAVERGEQQPEAEGAGSSEGSGSSSSSETSGDSEAAGSGSECEAAGRGEQEPLHPYLCRFRRGGGSGGRSRGWTPWNAAGRPARGSTPEHVRVRG